MCDRPAFEKLRDRVTRLEMSDASQDEKLKTLFRAQRIQFWTVWGAFMMTLLALIYGALGPRGFNAVTNAAPKLTVNAAGN